jgi:hypothetical protein
MKTLARSIFLYLFDNYGGRQKEDSKEAIIYSKQYPDTDHGTNLYVIPCETGASRVTVEGIEFTKESQKVNHLAYRLQNWGKCIFA